MKKPKARATKSKPRKRGRSWPDLRALLDVWAFAPLVLWLLAQLEAYVWVGALLAELHFQLALCVLLAAAVLLARKQWLRGGLWCVWALLLLTPLWPLWRPVHGTPFQGGPLVRVAQSHLAGATLTPAKLASWLAAQRCDVLSTTGLSAAQRKALLHGAFGYTALPGHEPDALLFARDALAPRRRADAHVSLRVGQCDLELTQLEAPSLLAPTSAGARRAQLAALLAADLRKRSMYIGALGSRSAAHDLRAFMDRQGLRDVRLGHGRLATGPSWLGPLGLAHDQILVRGWIAVEEASVSDPIVSGANGTLRATLQLTEPRCR